MEELYAPKVIAALLQKYQLAPLKKLGQNFLRDENIVEKIAQAAVCPGENVLEIGPGLGVLTRALARRAKKVVAVEIDKGMELQWKSIRGWWRPLAKRLGIWSRCGCSGRIF